MQLMGFSFFLRVRAVHINSFISSLLGLDFYAQARFIWISSLLGLETCLDITTSILFVAVLPGAIVGMRHGVF